MITHPRVPRLLTASVNLYRALLVLYPTDYRKCYGQHMTQVFRDMCRDAYGRGGAWGLLDWWTSALLDLILTVIEERRKVKFTVTKAKFIQWSGLFLIIGGLLIGSAGISQLQPGSHYTFYGIYQLAIFALGPGMLLVSLGLLGVWMRYNGGFEILGRITMAAAVGGGLVMAFAWVFTFFISDSAWIIMMLGWLVHLIGVSVFGGMAASKPFLPKWHFAPLIGSGLPLTIIVLSLQNQSEPMGANWSAAAILALIAISWILTGIALNSKFPEAQRAAA